MIWLTALSWGSKAVPFLRSPKVMAAIVGVVAVGLLWAYVSHLQNKVESLAADKVMYKTWYQVAADKNASNQEAIRLLRGANEALAKSVTISEKERIMAVAEAAEREFDAKLALDNTLDDLEDLRNETPSCAELSQIDMGLACPLVTERLREHAAGTIGRN